jgi:hypothetical protein
MMLLMGAHSALFRPGALPPADPLLLPPLLPPHAASTMLALRTTANAAAPRRAFVDRMRTAPSLDQDPVLRGALGAAASRVTPM